MRALALPIIHLNSRSIGASLEPNLCGPAAADEYLQLHGTHLMDRLIDAQLILCAPGRLGISLKFASSFTTSYEVGDLKEANQELSRVRARLDRQRS
jgi:hypothetical protein